MWMDFTRVTLGTRNCALLLLFPGPAPACPHPAPGLSCLLSPLPSVSVFHRGVQRQPAGAPGIGLVAGGDSSSTAGEHAGCPGETAKPGEHACPPQGGEPPRPRAGLGQNSEGLCPGLFIQPLLCPHISTCPPLCLLRDWCDSHHKQGIRRATCPALTSLCLKRH